MWTREKAWEARENDLGTTKRASSFGPGQTAGGSFAEKTFFLDFENERRKDARKLRADTGAR